MAVFFIVPSARSFCGLLLGRLFLPLLLSPLQVLCVCEHLQMRKKAIREAPGVVDLISRLNEPGPIYLATRQRFLHRFERYTIT